MHIALIVFVVVAYVVLPQDVIPDSIRTFGFADDGFIVGLALSVVGKLLEASKPRPAPEESTDSKA